VALPEVAELNWIKNGTFILDKKLAGQKKVNPFHSWLHKEYTRAQ
jgi:hypothetical protein